MSSIANQISSAYFHGPMPVGPALERLVQLENDEGFDTAMTFAAGKRLLPS